MDSDAADEIRLQLIERLQEENAYDLADKLERCGEEIILVCLCCGAGKPVGTHCKRKWCPSCQQMIAARRGARFRNAVAKMQWPLFVTLTMRNTRDPSSIKLLRDGFRKLRARKIWKTQVAGGVAGLEVTNRGNGWHPHLHAVVDCKWLSVTVPEPTPTDTKKIIRLKCEHAARELSATWADIVKQDSASVKIRRCYGSSIVQEILKYSVKGDDLLNCEDEIAPLIRILTVTRLVTSFGNLHGIPLDDETPRDKKPCQECHQDHGWLPSTVVTNVDRWSKTGKAMGIA